MGSNELLTVREFAQAAGVSRQRIYQLIDDNGELSSYVVDYHGRRMLKAEGLRLFGCMDIIVDDLTSDKDDLTCVKDAQSSMNSDIDVSCQERLDTESSRTFDTVTSVLGDELEILKQELGMLQEQLKAKDEQIARLQEHIDKQHETIQALTILSQGQLIDKSGQGSEVMDAVDVSEVPEDPEGESSGGSSSEGESAAAPKRRGPLGMLADAIKKAVHRP